MVGRGVKKGTGLVESAREAGPVARPGVPYREFHDHTGPREGKGPGPASGRPKRSGCGDERRLNRLRVARNIDRDLPS